MKTNFLKAFLLFAFIFSTVNLFAQNTVNDTAIVKVTGVGSINFDKSTDPSQDFYEYVNGGWLKRTQLPAGKSRWGSFYEIDENNGKIVRKILLEAMNGKNKKDSPMQKVGDFYYTAMDTIQMEKQGYDPIKPYLDKVNNIKDREDYIRTIGEFSKYRLGSLFGFFAGADDKDNTSIIVQLFQGGLGLPEREYYFKQDPKSVEIRNKYTELITKLFTLTGDDAATANSKALKVLDIETHLADASMKRVAMRDPYATYHKMSYDELITAYPNLKFETFFKALDVNDPKYFTNGLNMNTPDFFATLNNYFMVEDLANLKTFLRWKVLSASAGMLSSDFRNAAFDFNSRTLQGINNKQPRWKDAVQITEGNLGQILGQAYIDKNFSPKSKLRVKELVSNLLTTLKERISNLTWMSDETKQQAYNKISTFRVKIGYPDKWRDYSALKVDRSSLFNNIMRSREFTYKTRTLDLLGKPVDKDEFGMLPQTVNASYSSTMNAITFPAGILQVPFFYANGDDAYNYGSIGAVIGHEITHGFDDSGRKYDADGNLKDWWTAEDAKKYNEISQKIIDRFNSFTSVDTLHVNGALTIGENTADLGGLRIALESYKKTESFKSGKVVDGFTPLQRFFLAYATVWRMRSTDESKRMLVSTDPHSPENFRVLGPLPNMDEFYEAFNIKEGSPYYIAPENRIRMW